MSSISTCLRLLAPATLIAAGLTLGGSAIGDPATACAVPNFDADFYEKCLDEVDSLRKKGLSDEGYRGLLKACCEESGGTWVPDKPSCQTTSCGACNYPMPDDPAAPNPAQPGIVAPPPGGATENPPPPPRPQNPGVVSPRPGVVTTETFTPAPIG